MVRPLQSADCAPSPGAERQLDISAQLTPVTVRRVVNSRWCRRLAAHALSMGAERRSLTMVHWNIAADCKNPPAVLYEGRPEARELSFVAGGGAPIRHYTHFADGFDRDAPMSVVMEVKCRRCAPCLKRRSGMWSLRAQAELQIAPRTWFGTLTVAPEHQYRALLAARDACSRRGVDYNSLPSPEQFVARHNQLSPELTKWLKRVRKESGAKLRYILVAEAHKSGDPHYHILVHETGWSHPVRERTLRRQWLLGFSKWNLVDDPRAARYVCKYLAKAAEARVRASVRYGSITAA